MADYGRELFDLISRGDEGAVQAYLKRHSRRLHVFLDWANNSFGECGETALQCAARKGLLAIVQMLVEAGAKINSKDWVIIFHPPPAPAPPVALFLSRLITASCLL
eukprot:scaffold974_cov176-Ochromonas_danica.AAC.12